MLEFNIPKQYEEKAKEIMMPFSVEIKARDSKEVQNQLNAFISVLQTSSKHKLTAQKVQFGPLGDTVHDPVEANTDAITNALKNEKDTVFLIANKEGAVFCVTYSQIGDKGYFQCFSPETARNVRDEQRSLLAENGLQAPRELTLFEKICNALSMFFLNHPIEAAARREAYRTFYENMQRNIGRTGRLADKGAARKTLGEKDRQENARKQRIQDLKKEIADGESSLLAGTNAYQNMEKKLQAEETKLKKDLLNYEEDQKRLSDMSKRQKDTGDELRKIDMDIIQNQKDLQRSLDRKKQEAALEEAKAQLELCKRELAASTDRLKEKEITDNMVGTDSDGVFLKAEEYLKIVYENERAAREKQYLDEKKARDDKIEEQKQVIGVYEQQINKLKSGIGYFKRSDDVNAQLDDLANDLKNARETHKHLQDEGKQAQKKFEDEEKAKRKEMLKPSKEKLRETEEILQERFAKYKANRAQYESEKKRMNDLTATVKSRQETYDRLYSQFHTQWGEKDNDPAYYQAKQEKLQQRKKDLTNENSDLLEQIRTLNEKLPKTKQSITEAQTAFNQNKTEFNQMGSNLKSVANRLDTAREELRKLTQPEVQQQKKKDEGVNLGRH